jgi:hypothetical protein
MEMDKNSDNNTNPNLSNFNQTTTLTVDNMKTASRNSSFKDININNKSLLVFSDFKNKYDNSVVKNGKKQIFISQHENMLFELDNRLLIKEKELDKQNLSSESKGLAQLELYLTMLEEVSQNDKPYS